MRCSVWGALVALAVAATGCGVSFNTLPTVTLSPASLSWHKVNIGSTSGQKEITVTNTSPAKAIPLTISSINLSPNFIQTANTCPIAPQLLAPGASCTISVAFRPQDSGNLTGTLSITDNAMNSPSVVSLSAVGGVGFLLFNPTSLDFPGVAANTVSQPQTATLTNEGTTPVTIATIIASAHFSEGDNCPVSPNFLAPGGSCTVTVTSNPVASGVVAGAINVKDNFGNVTQLYLTGSDQGRQAVGVLDFSPSSLLWGKVAVGGTSAAKTITITNTQSASVSFSNIATGRDFTITASTCPATLDGGQACSVSVAFRPGTAGSITELLTFTDNAQGSPQALALNGTGILGDLLFTPTALSFAGVDPGKVSPAQAATLTNQTQSSLTLSSIGVSGHFAQTNNCPAVLGPQASCTFEVTANPTADGAITGAVNVKDSSGNSTQLYLKGQGGNTDKVLSFSPNPLVWGTIDVGQTSGAKILTVNNGQTVPLTIDTISIGPDFIETTSTCPTAPSTVAAGASCTISLAFRPQSAGAKSEVITFTDDAPGGNQSVPLNGSGAVGSLLFNPTSLAFGGIDPNAVSQAQTATLTNELASSITLASISLSGHFAQTNDCPSTLGPGGSCTITVTSNPVIDGPTQGSVNVKDGSGATTQLYLSGMGGIPINGGNAASNARSASPISLLPATGQAVPAAPQGQIQITPQASSCVELTQSVQPTDASASYSSFAIDPESVSLPPNEQYRFQTQVCGAPDANNVIYSVDDIEGGNSSVGEITQDGVYTAPGIAGKHMVEATDTLLGVSSSAVVTVFSDVTVDFGSRTDHKYPIPTGMLGANHIGDLHDPNDIELLSEAGLKLSRTDALIPQVYATQTPDWSKIDQRIVALQAAGMHVVLQIAFTPSWLQPNPNPCGAGSTATMPTNVQAWAKIAASYVAHMDASFPGVVTDYEIWDKPDAGGLCGTNKMKDYESIYAAAAPLMKQQAAADDAFIRVGGPATANPNPKWISALLSDASTAPYVDFVSYHNYMQGASQAEVTWNAYNGITPVYQTTQGPTSAAAAYSKMAAIVTIGKQPGRAITPIYIDGYNTNSVAARECCRNDTAYSPVWNALYVSDMLNTVYTGTAAVPEKLIYSAASAYPYSCLLGIWNAAMDCANAPDSSLSPYPQYYAYQLVASHGYLDMSSGGYMAASIAPPIGSGGLAVTAFYTSTQDSILIVNSSSTRYSQLTINARNIGLSSPQAVVYQIVDGNQITSSSLPLAVSGSSYTGSISVPPYSVMAIAIHGQ